MPWHGSGIGILMLFTANMLPAIVEGFSDKFTDMRDGMSTEDNVYIIQIGQESLAVALGDAAPDSDNSLAAWSGRQALTRTALSVQARIRSFTYATRHEDNDISLSRSGNFKRAE